MRSHHLRIAVWAAALVAAAAQAADAKPRRVVVLDFDGQRSLADQGRNTVLSMLGDTYDVVATQRWEGALAQAPGRGTRQWGHAAKAVGVDAVIEGIVEDEGRHHVLTVVVRDAATSNELDTVSVNMGEHGLSNKANHKLEGELEDVLNWIQPDPTASEVGSTLPDVRAVRPLIGARFQGRARHRIEDDGDAEDDDGGGDLRDRDDDRRERDRDDDRRERRHLRDRDDDRDRDRDADPPKSDLRPIKHEEPKPTPAVATVDPDTSDLVKLFGPDSKEAAIVSDNKTVHVAKPTPRFAISAGGYVASRGMSFEQDPNSTIAAPEYPASSIKGFVFNAAVYPLPTQKTDGILSGPGFTLSVARSVGSTLSAMDDTGYGDYTLEHTAWELGVHYRIPIDVVAVDGEVNYGNVSHAIIDLPESIQIPDTQVSYLGVGAHVDLRVTEGATVGVGGRYMYVLDAGDIMSEDWYGSGGASGLALDANFVIPLPDNLFVKGAVEYRRVEYEFEGSGTLAQYFGMWSATDTSIAGSAQLGVQF